MGNQSYQQRLTVAVCQNRKRRKHLNRYVVFLCIDVFAGITFANFLILHSNFFTSENHDYVYPKFTNQI
jgi:hypothetical protein